MSPVAAAPTAALCMLLAAGSASAAPRKTKTPVPATPSRTPTAAVTRAAAPRPAALVPDPPYVGTPAAGEKPYAAILRAREAGASDEQLLARIAKENVRYSLSTPEIQQLRAAGVSSRVIEAMLRSGRTPLPTAARPTTPTAAP